MRATTSILSSVVLVSIVCSALAVAADESTLRLDRLELLQYRDSDGTVRYGSTAADWQRRRADIVLGMHKVMGSMPNEQRRVPLIVDIVEEVDVGDYVRQLITYQSEPNSRTPAYLCIPKSVIANERTTSAVLCLHPTDRREGHKVVVGLGGRPRRQYAAELAGRGYVTLSPAYPQLANYWPNLAELGYQSGTMKAIWDNMRGLDLLASLDGIVDDSRGFAAIGHSLGGHNAIYTAVFDQRITVLVSSCGFDSFLDYYDGDPTVWYFGKGWCSTRYMPLLSNFRGRLQAIPFDFPELLGAMAPRPLLINAPLGDSNFQHDSVDSCVSAARPIYQLLGAPQKLQVIHPDCQHDFPDAAREQAYRLIDSVLGK